MLWRNERGGRNDAIILISKIKSEKITYIVKIHLLPCALSNMIPISYVGLLTT